MNFYFKHTAHLGNLGLDFHNHILPGIDDGAVDLEEAHKIRIALKDRGIDYCVYTPHIYNEIHPNTKQTIKNSFDLLMNNIHYHNEFGDDRYAAEYMLDTDFAEMVNENQTLLSIKGKQVLIEFSITQKPIIAEETIYNLLLKGYTPIIAHPERYMYLQTTHEYAFDYTKLKEMGCEFQLNLLSLNGQYGKSVKDIAVNLLKKEMYDYASTDIHNTYQIPTIDTLLKSMIWKKWCKYPFKNQELI
jgi:hypothetical protein